MFIQSDTSNQEKNILPSLLLNICGRNGTGKSFQYKYIEEKYKEKALYVNLEGDKASHKSFKNQINLSDPLVMFDVFYTLCQGYGHSKLLYQAIKEDCRNNYFKVYIQPILYTKGMIECFLNFTPSIFENAKKFTSFEEEVLADEKMYIILNSLYKVTKEKELDRLPLENIKDWIEDIISVETNNNKINIFKDSKQYHNEEGLYNMLSTFDPRVLSSLAIHFYLGAMKSAGVLFVDSLTACVESYMNMYKITPEKKMGLTGKMDNLGENDLKMYGDTDLAIGRLLSSLKILAPIVITTCGVSQKTGMDGTLDPLGYNISGSSGKRINEKVGSNVLLERDLLSNKVSFSWSASTAEKKRNTINYKLNTENPAQIENPITRLECNSVVDLIDFILKT